MSSSNNSTTDNNTTATVSNNLLWASTGGGWRAMFCDVGFANLFQQAGLLSSQSSQFQAISTVSGGSWFSTQLFYSPEFYNRTALASSPEQIEAFVLEWMDTYYEISTDITPEVLETCDLSDMITDNNEEALNTMMEFCHLLETYDYDWAYFINEMLKAASSEATGGYGTNDFVNTLASADNIIPPLQTTDLLIQSALAPASRVRSNDGGNSDTAVYLGNANDESLWTVALSAAWIVDTLTGRAEWAFGINKEVGSNATLQTYVASTSVSHSWSDWADFHLYQGNGTTTGTARIDNTVKAEPLGAFASPFGGITPTVIQVAATSSAAAGSASPLVPVSYTQNLSIGYYTIQGYTTETWARVLVGIAAGLVPGLLLGWSIAWVANKYKLCKSCGTRRTSGVIGAEVGVDDISRNVNGGDADNDVDNENAADEVQGGSEDEVVAAEKEDEVVSSKKDIQDNNDTKDSNYCCCSSGDHPARNWGISFFKKDSQDNNGIEYNNCCCCSCVHPARNWGISCGFLLGIVLGVFSGVFYGIGSIFVPNFYDTKVDEVYRDVRFDNFAVCSQWPNQPCDEQDGFLVDGWFADNPALPINIGHRQQKISRDETIKVILTNCNDLWDTEWNRAQYLAYFSTYFNEGIAPGMFSWGPGWFMPSRSQQIFSEFLDPAGLDALLEPIANSSMTTALLLGTTVDNPAYNVRAGQRVEMLLLNANANITTMVVGKTAIETYRQPLADMTSHIAGSEELLTRILDFVGE